MNLPIDVVPRTDPPIFRWRHTVGATVQECEGLLPAGVEQAVVDLVQVAKRAMMDNAMLTGRVDTLESKAGERAGTLVVAQPPIMPSPKNKRG